MKAANPELMLAIRRTGGLIHVVVSPSPGYGLLEEYPEDDWADAGGPIEVPIALELLSRVSQSAPEPLAGVCREAGAKLVEAMTDALDMLIESAEQPLGEWQ